MKKNIKIILGILLIIGAIYLFKSGLFATIPPNIYQQPSWVSPGSITKDMLRISGRYSEDSTINFMEYIIKYGYGTSSAENHPGTWTRATILKNGVIIYNYDMQILDGNGNRVSTQFPEFSDDEIYAIESVNGILDIYTENLTKQFNIDIKPNYFYDGLDLTRPINITILNNRNFEFNARMWVWVEKGSGFTGKEIINENLCPLSESNLEPNCQIHINSGLNNYEIDIPREWGIGEYIINVVLSTPSMIVNAGSSFYPGGIPNYFKLTESSQKFLINPKPIIIIVNEGDSCPNGYEFQPNSNTSCIRSDYSYLTCYDVGCPIVQDYSYGCTSAGTCAQMLAQFRDCKTDEDCGAGLRCQASNGMCFYELAYDRLVTCVQNDDCINPCPSEMSASCENNECKYTGECTPKKENCEDFGCPEGYTCEDKVCTNVIVIEDNEICKYMQWSPDLFSLGKCTTGFMMIIAFLGLLILFKKR